MKKRYILGLTLSCFLLLAETNFAQTSHSVLVAPGGQLVFQPADLTISVGDTVVWEWQRNNHTSTSDATSGAEVWDSGILNSGATFSRVFTTVGAYPYHCTPHRSLGMVGTITVEAITGIEHHSELVADNFALEQNYPNPFNPTTTIRYALPEMSNVRLVIYDLQGRAIKQWVNPGQDPGWYKLVWDGTNQFGHPVSAGIYFMRIQAGQFIQTRKMLLLK